MAGRLKSVALYTILIAVLGFALLGYEIHKLKNKAMMIETTNPIIIVVDRNTTASSFVQMLEAKHLIRSSRILLALIRFQGLTQRLKAGIYEIKPGDTAQQLLEKVEAGKVMVRSFRIIEGTNLNQVTTNLEHAPYLKYKESDWQAVTDNHASAEGLLLADTYNYDAGSEAKPLLQLAHKNLQAYLEQSWQNRSPGLPYKSSYELLIAASILEKEAALAQERKLISGVVVNRLNKNMPLQMDPTVIYGLGQNFSGKLSHNDMSVNSAYNTYINRGLPPTPIAMVGKEAIDAAAHPELTNYLYFVAKGDGSHQFSATYEEQRKAIARYQTKGPS